MVPMNKKLEELNLQKDELLMENENKETGSVSDDNYGGETENIAIYKNKEIIEINNKMEKITDVEYIEKDASDNINGAEKTILNIKIKGSENDIFTAIESVEKMNIKTRIKSIEIEKFDNEYVTNIDKNNDKGNKKNSKNRTKGNNKKLNSYTCTLKLEIV